jgi:hypothetical protein
MNKWEKLAGLIDKEIKNNDRRINAFMNQTPINHNAILQLQIQNAELVRIEYLMDELYESEAE